MYSFVDKDERDKLSRACEEIIKSVQKQVREFFTFDYKLIGSGEKRLVTKNGNNGNFDLDYNFIIKKDKKNLVSNPDKIKQIFLNAFNAYNPSFGFKYAKDSTSVVTSQLILEQKLHFSFDVAILIEGNNGNFYKLIFDKNSGRYIWNEVNKSKNYQARFKMIKDKGYWLDFKKRYLELKNMHLSRQDLVKSFSIFLETLNEFFH